MSDMSRKEIVKLLESDDPKLMEQLFHSARETRQRTSGNKIFTYGFVYFTTYCRNNCNFCYYRRSNDIERYSKSTEEILGTAKGLIESGVNLIDLTMGEDPEYHKDNFKKLAEIVKTIKNDMNTPVMVSPGVVSHQVIDSLADAGADWYAVYQETHNRDLFAKLRTDQSYDDRMGAKLYARDRGMLIEEGLLAGVGESNEDIADSFMEMKKMKASQVRVMSFVPQKGSPMEKLENPGRMKELKMIAVMRQLFPYALIPASLDVDGIGGLRDRINAGANLVTSIIPPQSGLMGVAHSTMDVDDGGRTVSEVRSILSEMELVTATSGEYKEYMRTLRKLRKEA